MKNVTLFAILIVCVLSIAGCSGEITNESPFAMPFTERNCTRAFNEVRDTFGSRAGPTDEPPFRNAFLLESAVEAFENLGYSFDATLRSMFFVDWVQHPHCRELEPLIPFNFEEIAVEHGIISERTALVMRFMDTFETLELSNATTRVLTAIQQCEQVYGSPCALRNACEFFDEGALHQLSGQHVRTCEELFARRPHDFQYPGQRIFLNANTDFFLNQNGSKISNRITADDAWTINNEVLQFYQEGHEIMVQERNSFR